MILDLSLILEILIGIVRFIFNLWLAQFFGWAPPFFFSLSLLFGVPPPRTLDECLPTLLACLRNLYRSRIGHALAVIYFALRLYFVYIPELFWFGVDFVDLLADVTAALNHKLPQRTALEVVVATV